LGELAVSFFFGFALDAIGSGQTSGGAIEPASDRRKITWRQSRRLQARGIWFPFFFFLIDRICLQLSIPHDFFFSFNWPRSDLVDVNGAMIELPLRRPVSYALSFS
jgi:hypothetical protein